MLRSDISRAGGRRPIIPYWWQTCNPHASDGVFGPAAIVRRRSRFRLEKGIVDRRAAAGDRIPQAQTCSFSNLRIVAFRGGPAVNSCSTRKFSGVGGAVSRTLVSITLQVRSWRSTHHFFEIIDLGNLMRRGEHVLLQFRTAQQCLSRPLACQG